MDRVSHWLKSIGLVFVVAVAYALLAWISQELVYKHADVCALWPAAGIGLAAVRWRLKVGLVGTLLGSTFAVAFFFSKETHGWPLVVISGVTGLGAIAEAWAGAMATRWLEHRKGHLLDSFATQRLFLFGIAPLSAAISAAVGVGIRIEYGKIPADDRFTSQLFWTLGDYLGIVLIAPFALALFRRTNSLPPQRWLHYGVFFVATTGLTAAIFRFEYPLTIILCVPILVACFYFPTHWCLGTAAVVALYAAVATTGVLTEKLGLGGASGPLLNRADPLYTPFNLYPFLGVLGVIALTVSAGLQTRRIEFEDLLATSPAGIAWSDESTKRFTTVNMELCNDLGYASEEDMLAIEDVEERLYVDKGDRAALQQKLNNPEGRGDHKFEAKKKDQKKKIWLHVYARRVKRDGRLQILGFARDVTEGQRRRKKNEIVGDLAKLLASPPEPNSAPWEPKALEIIRAAIGATRVSLWRVSEGGRTLDRLWTNAASSNDQLSLYSSYDAAKIAQLALDKEKCGVLSTPDDAEANAFPLASNGETVGVIVATKTDWLFSERLYPDPEDKDKISLESVLTTAGQMIVEAMIGDQSIQQNQDIMELAEVGIFYSNADGVPIRVNKKYYDILGIKPGYDLALWYERLTDDTREEIRGKWRQWANDQKATTFPKQEPQEPVLEVLKSGPDDRDIRVAEVVARPIRRGNRLTGFVGVVQDITELDRRRVDLKLSLHAIDHDCKNILCGLASAIEQMKQNLRPEYGYLADVARSCHDDIAGLIEEQSSTSEITGSERFRTKSEERFDPVLLARAACEIAHRKPSVTIAVEQVGEIPGTVEGPRKTVSRVLHNLVKNAVEHASSAVAIRILYIGNAAAPRIEYEVINDGAWETAKKKSEVLDRLRWPEHRLKRWLDKRKVYENGRGLPLSQIALWSAESNLEVDETADGRQRFRFAIPVRELTDSQLAKRPERAMPLKGLGPVLLVDDDQSVRSGLASKLLAWGIHPLVVCHSGEQALNHAKGIDFKLILLDINMDGQDGYKTLKEIRAATASRPRPKVVCISVTDLDWLQQKEAGFDDRIPKDSIVAPDDLARIYDPELVRGRVEILRPTEPGAIENLIPQMESGRLTAAVGKLAILAAMANPAHTSTLSPEQIRSLETKFHKLRHQLMAVSQWKRSLENLGPSPHDHGSLDMYAPEYAAMLKIIFEKAGHHLVFNE